MTTWQLALLTLVAPLAPRVAAAPKPVIAGAPGLGSQFNQFGAFDQYDPQLYNQRANDYSYSAVPQNNGQYGNGYYSDARYGNNYYDPAVYGYNQYTDQTNSHSGKQDSYGAESHKPLKADTGSDGKYDPKKYNTGKYDAKLYNSGQHNARNYDTGHYDHSKYGTKPVNSAKLTQAPGSHGFRAESAGAESGLVKSQLGRNGFSIRSDGNGGFKWRQFGHDGKDVNFVTNKFNFVQNDSSFHGKKLGILKKDSVHKEKESVKKDSVGNDFSFNTKQVFSKIDVFGPNHKQIFTGGKRVFNDGRGPIPSPIKLSDPPPAIKGSGSQNGFDSYGFYSDLSNLYSENSFDKAAPPPEINVKATDEFGKDFDSYGYYSDVSNLYADSKQGGESSVDASLNQRQSPNSLNFNGKTSTVTAFELAGFRPGPVRSTGSIDDSNTQSPGDVTERPDSYGFYSDLSNLYGSKPWKPLDSAAGLDAVAAFTNLDAGLSENQLDFDNHQAPTKGKVAQDVSPNDSGFDSYGFYSNLDNLYSPEKSKTFPLRKSATKNSNAGAKLDRPSSFGDNAEVSANDLDLNSQQIKTRGQFSQRVPSDDIGFDSYGFYSNLDNLYRVDASEGIPKKPVTRKQSQLTASLDGHRVRNMVRNNVKDDRDRQFQVALTDRDRGLKDRNQNSFRSRELDPTHSQNNVEFDSYEFYSDPRNLYA